MANTGKMVNTWRENAIVMHNSCKNITAMCPEGLCDKATQECCYSHLLKLYPCVLSMLKLYCISPPHLCTVTVLMLLSWWGWALIWIRLNLFMNKLANSETLRVVFWRYWYSFLWTMVLYVVYRKSPTDERSTYEHPHLLLIPIHS